ncbi:MAG: putative transrane protein [Phycisphaerales bacterium]|nr:putative transrane protein [Phycisphaerales bacterium]
MISAQAYSFRQKSKLAISLSWIGGYTNVVALITCHATISHMTGATTSFGEAVAGGDYATALFLGFILITFFTGACLSALMTEGARRRGIRSKYILPMLVEAVLLLIFALATELLIARQFAAGGAVIWWMTGAASMAMGLQNATITRISGNVVRTTHLTGVITDLGLEGVQYLYWWRDKTRSRHWSRNGRLFKVSRRHPTVLRLLLLLSIFGSFLLGVLLGTWAYKQWPSYAMIAPIAFLLWIVWVDYRKPIADARELDLLGDPELKAYGILHSLLPKDLGIYRIGPHLHANRVSDPDFQTWVERMPERWKVVILALTPLVRLTSNALMDLDAAYERLRGNGRRLIICGITPSQYKLLDGSGMVDKLGAENVCPDLEFAVAQGIEMLQPIRTA